MKDKKFRQDFVNGFLFYVFLAAVIMVVGSLLNFLVGAIFGSVSAIATLVIIVAAILGAAYFEARVKSKIRDDK